MAVWIDISPWLAHSLPPAQPLERLLDASLPDVAFCVGQPGGTPAAVAAAEVRALLQRRRQESAGVRLLRRFSGRPAPVQTLPGAAPGAKDVLLTPGAQRAEALLHETIAVAFRGHSAYEDRLEHFYQQLLRAGDCAIDIGAHTGRHALPMAAVVGAGGRVIAFEPNPAIAATLKARVSALGFGQVAVHGEALSDESGSAEFVVAVDLPEESGLKERAVYNGFTRTERIGVQLARLDELLQVAPRFIKLDTEGAELKVLRGARQTIASSQPVVAFEFGEASYAAYDVDPLEVFDFFDALGYDIFSILGDALARDAFAQASRVQAYWDYVACPRGEARHVQSILQSFQPAR